MESYRSQNKLPSVTRSSASHNSTDFESKKEEGEQLHLPSIDDVKSCHSNEERVMSKEECAKYQSNKNLTSYLSKDFNYYKG